MRNLAQVLAKEYAQDIIHVAHVIVDGPLDGEKIRIKFLTLLKNLVKKDLLVSGLLMDIYFYTIKKTAWSFELDLRNYKENW